MRGSISLSFLALLTLLVAAGTVLFGWMAAVAVGFGGGLLRRGARGGLWCGALAGGAAWAALLAYVAAVGEAGRLAAAAGGVMGLPGWGFVIVTILFGAALTATGTAAGHWLRTRWRAAHAGAVGGEGRR